MKEKSVMNDEIRVLWSRTIPALWPERYWLVSMPPSSLQGAAEAVRQSYGRFAALVVEKDEVSLTVEQSLWEFHKQKTAFVKSEGPYRVITLRLNLGRGSGLDLGICGYFAPAAALLAEAGIPIVPQCAFLKDHVLVRDSDAARAMEVLNGLVKSCAENRDSGIVARESDFGIRDFGIGGKKISE
jgi:hypothetical protein